MFLSVIAIIVVAAFIVAVLAGSNKAPLWVAVLLLCVVELLQIAPLGR